MTPYDCRETLEDEKYSKITDIMERARKSSIFPGAYLLFAKRGNIKYKKVFGHGSLVPEISELREDTIFDIASLTKVIATTTALMILVRDRYLEIDDRASKFIPSLVRYGKSDITLRHLLCHASGLPAWKPYYKVVCNADRIVPNHTTKNLIYEMVHKEKLVYPLGEDSQYSDLGFILLEEIIEKASGKSLENFCNDRIFNPLGMKNTFYIKLADKRNIEKERFAATEKCLWRKRVLRGEVHDANAYAMGGVAGHAGLFATGEDIYFFAKEMLEIFKGKEGMIPKETLEKFVKRQESVKHSSRALGWDTPSRIFSTSGRYFSNESIGHTGFTGVSLWIDLKREIVVILLSNRVHPTRENPTFNQFRPYIHDVIMEELLKEDNG